MIANLHPGPDRRLALHFNNPSVALRPIGRQMGGHAGEVLQYDAHLSFGPHADAEVHRAHSPFWNDATCNVQVAVSHTPLRKFSIQSMGRSSASAISIPECRPVSPTRPTLAKAGVGAAG